MTITLLQGDCRTVLATLAPASIQTIITSPPYYGLRQYTPDPREIGQEATPDCLAWARREPPCGACYVCALRAVFAQLWRVLRDDGTCWLNLGDSYSQASTYQAQQSLHTGAGWKQPDENRDFHLNEKSTGVPAKNLLMIPARVALALQSDGWYLRSDIIWEKPSCMPESVTDRCTRSHEYVFLLAKSARYFYDAAAIAEPATAGYNGSSFTTGKTHDARVHLASVGQKERIESPTRNKRTVWRIAGANYPGSHYAVMPEALVEVCLKAGSAARACETCGAAWGRVVEREESEYDGWKQSVNPADKYKEYEDQGLRGSKSGLNRQSKATYYENAPQKVDKGFAPRCRCAVNTGAAASTVLDPFAGSGTVPRVALRYQRNAIGIELNQAYLDDHVEKRTDGAQIEMFV